MGHGVFRPAGDDDPKDDPKDDHKLANLLGRVENIKSNKTGPKETRSILGEINKIVDKSAARKAHLKAQNEAKSDRQRGKKR